MNSREIRKLVAGTADAAFALDPDGLVAAWNESATELFGVSADDAIGKACAEVLHGVDECGRMCSEHCTIRRMAASHQPLRNYDIRVQNGGKDIWCNISVLIVDGAKHVNPFTVHIARPVDLQKRFEMLMRDFVVRETNLPAVNVNEIIAAKNTPTNFTELSPRETEILRMLARGETTAGIAKELFISRTTVNNHVQRILKKLSAHSRLEAVRRAELAGLI